MGARLGQTFSRRGGPRTIAAKNGRGGIAQQGQLNASLTTPWPGAPQIAANLFSGGKLKSGEAWEAAIDLSGITKPPPRQFGDLPATLPADGAAKEFEWKLTAPSLAWHGKEPVTLKDVVARLRSRGTILDLEEMRLANGDTLSGRGRLDFCGENDWWLWLHGNDVPIPLKSAPKVSFDASLWGRQKFTKLEDLFVHVGEIEVWAGGFYDQKLPRPLDANVVVWAREGRGAGDTPPIIGGDFRSEAHLTGTAAPRDIALHGNFFATEFTMNGRPIGDSKVQLQGQITDAASHVETTECQLLAGRWKLKADYPDEQNSVRAILGVRDLPLPEVAQLLKAEPVGGTLTGVWKCDF